MAIDPELFARFQSLDDEELVARRLGGGLTSEASNALNAVLQQRGIDSARAHELLEADVGESASMELARLERARIQMRWLTGTFAVALGFLPGLFFLAAILGPSDANPLGADDIGLQFMLALWVVVVVSFYVCVYRTAATLQYSAAWMLIIAVIVKLLGWIVVYAALVAEYRRQRNALKSSS